MGWAFLTYKLDSTAESPSYSPSSVYWSFRLAVQQGYINLNTRIPGTGCLFKPATDFVKGDEPDPEPTPEFGISASGEPTHEFVPLPLMGLSSILLLFAALGLVVVHLRRQMRAATYQTIARDIALNPVDGA